MLLKYFIRFLFLFTLISQSWATESVVGQKITRQLDFKSGDGERFKISTSRYTNHLGNLEVELKSNAAPSFLKGINPVIGYGRDLNDNGLIDTWFIISEQSIKLVEKEGREVDGSDVLAEVLRKEFKSGLFLYFRTGVLAIFKYLLISINEAVETEQNYYRDWIDLTEADLRFKKLKEQNHFTISREQEMFHYQIQSYGYGALADTMDQFAKKDFWLLTGLDVGLWASGGVVLKWLGGFTIKIGRFLSESSFVKEIQVRFYKLIENHVNALKETMTSFQTKYRKITGLAANTVVVQSLKQNWRGANINVIKGMKSQNILYKVISKSLFKSKKFVGGALSEWRYIGLNASVQLGSETFAHYDEIKNDDPFLMAENILTNDEIQQNIAFMTSETMLMTAASKNLTTMKSKFAIGGLIALVNSTQMNLIVKGSDNYERVALDTAWEVLIGNTQVQMDLLALSYFEKLAVEKKNPKLKLIGYAVTLVDMGVGYYAYSKVSSHVDQNGLSLVPVFAEK